MTVWKLTPEREATIREALECDGTGPPHVSYLLAALDTERAAHRETRAEVERRDAIIKAHCYCDCGMQLSRGKCHVCDDDS